MRLAAFSALVFVLATPLIAKADDFSITGNGQNISFSLPGSPTPDSYVNEVGFLFNNVSVDVNGTSTPLQVGFGNVNQGGEPDLFLGVGESIGSNGNIQGGDPSYGFFTGNMLYTGAEADPTFAPGIYSIFNVEDPSLGGTPGGTYTLTITAPVTSSAVTPEPSSLLLLGTGLVGAVGAFRRRLA